MMSSGPIMVALCTILVVLAQLPTVVAQKDAPASGPTPSPPPPADHRCLETDSTTGDCIKVGGKKKEREKRTLDRVQLLVASSACSYVPILQRTHACTHALALTHRRPPGTGWTTVKSPSFSCKKPVRSTGTRQRLPTPLYEAA